MSGMNITGNMSDSASAFADVDASDKNDTIACGGQPNCAFYIGWSSASIYTYIRPDFILSLQPAWFLNSLKFSIH